MRIARYVCVYYSLDHLFPQTWMGMRREMRIAMYVYVYYSFDHLFPQHGRGFSKKWELQCLHVYIIPLITYFPTMEGVAHINGNCNVSMFILFPWSPISPTWRGLLTEMRIALSVYEYYSFDHLFFHHGGGCSQKWELQCMYVYIISLVTHFPKHGAGCWKKWELQCLYVYIIPLIICFPKHGGGCSHKWELQGVYVYIIPLITYFPKHVGGCSHKWELQCICVCYSLHLLFPQHGGGCSQKWELQCMYAYIITLITYFPNMEGVAERNENCNVCICILFRWSPVFPNMEGVSHRNENCNVCTCILFPWSPISPTWRWLLTEMRIAMSVYVYYSFDHIFFHHGVGCWEKWELQCMYVYIIPLITYFPKHGAGCWEKWELQCLCVYIIPLITYFPNMEGVAQKMREMGIAMSRIFPNMEGVAHINENCNVYVYIIPLITYFPNMVGVAERNQNCDVCVCILFPWSPISPNMEGVPHINENCNVCMFILFPWLPISLNMEGVAHRNENCKVCMCILFPWPPISPNMDGDAERNENCNVCICILLLWSPISPTWKGFLKEMRIAMSARVYYSLDHLFPHHGRGCAHKWELQCLYVYIIPLITYFPNMEGLGQRNENCKVCICILFIWSPIFPSLRGMLREMRVAMSVCV